MNKPALISRKREKRLETTQLGNILLALVFLFSFKIALCAQSENTAAPAAAKAPAAQPEKSPLILNISKDAGEQSVALDYSVRWDFSDLRGFKPSVKILYSIFKSAASWGLSQI